MNLGVGGAMPSRNIRAPTTTSSFPSRSSRSAASICRASARASQDTAGFFIYPSFDFNGERKPSDDKSLKGTKKIDWALEAGLGAGYRDDWFRAFATVRQGFNGYSGQAGEIGARRHPAAVAARSRSPFGPRRAWPRDGYMETYFGVTAKEAPKDRMLTAYKPGRRLQDRRASRRTPNYWVDRPDPAQLQGAGTG